MFKVFVTSFLVVLGSMAYAQNINYSILGIPTELKEDAGSVVRLSETIFDVDSESEATLFKKYAITILHESHRSNAYFNEYYNKFMKLSAIRICIYNGMGKLVKTVSKSDIKDMPAYNEGALFADIRRKVYDPEWYIYPFTIEYSFKKRYNGLLSYPPFIPLQNYDMSLETATYTLQLPRGIKPRYKEQNVEVLPQVSYTDEKDIYLFVIDSLKPFRDEGYEVGLQDLVPLIWFAPTHFIMDGYRGNASTWEDFGNWNYSLISGRDQLTENTLFEVGALVENVKDTLERIKKIYKYMQAKTRYVNVIIGIGGWQPITATEVDENGYGDCKALTNYMGALLNVVGIESDYTLVKAGSRVSPIHSDFPSNQFNHAILSVPINQDTLWLECTSQRNPFGYLSTFTEGRKALVVKDKGSRIVDTPSLSVKDNLRLRNAQVSINDQGKVVATVENCYQGLFYDDKRSVYYVQGKKRLDRVRNSIHIKHFVMEDADYTISEKPSVLPIFIEKYQVSTDEFVKKMGHRMLFDINFFNTQIDVPSSVDKQVSALQLQHSYTKIDTIVFIIPKGYKVKSFPKGDTLMSDFGIFQTNCSLRNDTLNYVRKQVVQKGIFSADKYKALRTYLKAISHSDNAKVLLEPEE